jgi:putative hydrolase of the HAD superfamily
MVGAVVFDIDGVLVHPWRFRAVLWRDHRISSRMTEPFFRGPFLECLEGRADLLEVLPPFLKAWHWSGPVSNFVETWFKVENAPNQQVLNLVAKVRRLGVPCFVASTQERHRARYLATEMRFEKMFDGMFFSSDLGVQKPNENFFRAVTDRVGHPAHELLFFDDSAENVRAARSAGWSAEQFKTAKKLRADLVRYTGLAVRVD